MSLLAASSPKFDFESFAEALCDDDDVNRLVRLSNFTFPDDFVKLELAAGALNARRMPAFAEALHSRSWSHIAELNLEFNVIHETGAEVLASALKFNRHITSINLGHCRIRDRGAAAIAGALIHNKDITFLGMSGNSIGDSGALALSEAIADNISITALDLESNEIGLGWFSSGKNDLASILATCKVCERCVIL
jgi:Ran GTPase-activating protein (RanGAP) involved in mRNA processing and transport